MTRMWVGIVSLFPEMFDAVTEYGITGRAIERNLVGVDCWNPREYTDDRHQTVDDKPYGGGPGMVMKVEPLKQAIQAAKSHAVNERDSVKCPVIYLSPQGKPLQQSDLQALASLSELILVAGRYEGIDERLIESIVDEEYSIGDFVVSGGELPAMILMDGITRLLPGAVGDHGSVEQDSFTDGLLDYPHYTRPETVDGLEVPPVLLSGDHQKIARWRRMQALGRTAERRPDLIAAADLNAEEQQLLKEYLEQGHSKEDK